MKCNAVIMSLVMKSPAWNRKSVIIRNVKQQLASRFGRRSNHDRQILRRPTARTWKINCSELSEEIALLEPRSRRSHGSRHRCEPRRVDRSVRTPATGKANWDEFNQFTAKTSANRCKLSKHVFNIWNKSLIPSCNNVKSNLKTNKNNFI